MKGIRIETNGNVEMAYGKDGNVDGILEFLYGAIGCELIDIVRARRLPEPYVMVVDDMGIMRGLPVNPRASLLYGTDVHGNPICGDAVILREELDPESGEMELKGLNEDDVLKVATAIFRMR